MRSLVIYLAVSTWALGAFAETLAEKVGIESSSVESVVWKPEGDSLNFTVTEAISGDTLQLANGKELRLLGVDAPTPSTPGQQGDFYAKEAIDHLNGLVKEKEVRVTFERRKQDGHGRFLGYVWLPDNEFLNYRVVFEGDAFADARPPVREEYGGAFKEAQEIAKEKQAGMWANPGEAGEVLQRKVESRETTDPNEPGRYGPEPHVPNRLPNPLPGLQPPGPKPAQNVGGQLRPPGVVRGVGPVLLPPVPIAPSAFRSPNPLPYQGTASVPPARSAATTRGDRKRSAGSFYLDYNPDGTIRNLNPKRGNPPSRYRYTKTARELGVVEGSSGAGSGSSGK